MRLALLLTLSLMLAACEYAPQKSAQADHNVNAQLDEAGWDNAMEATANADANMADTIDEVENATANAVDAGDAVDAGVESGRGAFIEPRDMEIDRWYTIEFIVGPDEAAVSTESEGQPLTESRPVFVSPAMRVTLLEDGNFAIRAKRDALQQTGADKTASWQWNVKPLRDGDHSLHARVEVLKRNDRGSYDTLEEYTRRVSVSVRVGTWDGFLNALRNAATLGDVLGTLFRSWEKTLLALGALLLAAFGVWRIIRKRGET